MSLSRFLTAISISLHCAFMSSAASAGGTTSDVQFPTLGQPLYPGATVPAQIPAILRIPDGVGPFPAVVIVHGSGGVDGRGAAMAEVLLEAGIASIEPDMWKPRGLRGGANSRPRIISDTLPDAWGAWAFLASDARIDAKKIGILGFSWGGAVSWITAFGLKPVGFPTELQNARFAAHVPFYASCTGYLPNAKGGKALAALGVKPTGAPMLFVMGTKDDYESSPESCGELARSYPEANMKLRMVEGATHGFDGPSYGSFFDGLAKDGKGGYINVVADPASATAVRGEVATFLKQVFK